MSALPAWRAAPGNRRRAADTTLPPAGNCFTVPEITAASPGAPGWHREEDKKVMKSIIFLMTAAVLLLAALPAQAVELREVIRALETPFSERKIQDYSASFSQESRIASLDRLQRASGKVRVRFDYQRSGQAPTVMFHWQYDPPTRQELVSNGKTLWVYLPENNQVIQSDLETVSPARENDPMTFLTGLGNLSRDFQISYAVPSQDAAGNYVLDLRPRRSSAVLNRMVIVVDRTAAEAITAKSGALVFPILSTTVYDPNGNSSTIEFSDLRVNRGISAGQFNFIMPPGVEVVRPTGKGMGF